MTPTVARGTPGAAPRDRTRWSRRGPVSPRGITRRLLLSAALLVAMLLAACGGDDGPGDEGASRTTTADTTTTTEPDRSDGDAVMPVGSPSMATVEEGGFPRGGGDPALLVDVRAAGHDGFDRVVLEFEDGTPPSYRVGYVDPPVREDFSGREVDVEGSAYLEIRASPAAGFDPLSEDARETYTGPRRLSPEGTEVVGEVVRIGDFEGQLAWVVGASQRVPFGVTTLDDPLRLVVDLVAGEAPGDGAIEIGNECTFTESRWEVMVPYPSGWVANDETVTDTGTVPACRIFDPDDAEPPRAHELTGYGFLVHVDQVDFDDVDGPSPDAQLLEEETLTVDGQRARRHEDRLTQTGLRGPEGARVTTYVVDLDGAILVARTHEVADLDYEHNRDVLDAVMARMSLRRA